MAIERSESSSSSSKSPGAIKMSKPKLSARKQLQIEGMKTKLQSLRRELEQILKSVKSRNGGTKEK